MSSEHRCMYSCFVTFGVYIDIEKKCNNPRNFSVLIHIGSEKTTVKYKILLGTICVAFFFLFYTVVKLYCTVVIKYSEFVQLTILVSFSQFLADI